MRKQISKTGFTLMEIIVATTIFAVVVSVMMSLFNYILKINRRSEALRQSAQGVRNFVEILTKEIRNGQINYFVVNGSTPSPNSPLGPCSAPAVVGGVVSSTYGEKENKVGVINVEGQEICFYFGDAAGLPQPGGTFSAASGGTLVMVKAGGEKQILNPPNSKIEQMVFFIRPVCDPYAQECDEYSDDLARIQPMVQVNIKYRVTLPTGETVPILYQTSVSTNKYDIPNQ